MVHLLSMMKKMCGVHKVAMLLVFVGALNWGLIGVAKFNLVSAIFGSVAWLERLVYVLVGFSALMMLMAKKCCMKCGGEGGKCGCGSGSGSCGPMQSEEKKM